MIIIAGPGDPFGNAREISAGPVEPTDAFFNDAARERDAELAGYCSTEVLSR